MSFSGTLTNLKTRLLSWLLPVKRGDVLILPDKPKTEPYEPWKNGGVLGPEYRAWKRGQPKPVASPLDNNALYGLDDALEGYQAIHWGDDDEDD